MSDTMTENHINISRCILGNKRILIISILAAAVLIVAAVIGASRILPKNISGAWELAVNPELPVATGDEVSEEDRACYVFEKPDKYGKGEYRTYYQSGVENYKYELLEENSVKKINLGTENLEYRITGSKLLGNAKLIVVLPAYTDEITGVNHEASEYVFEQTKMPEYEKRSFDEYQVDSRLTGTWTNKERTLSYYQYVYTYTQSVEIKDNGIMIIRYKSGDLALDRYMYYAYTAKDSELVFSPVTDKETQYKVSYEFDDGGNLKFVNDSTSGSIFADSFFGDFVFSASKNMTESVQTSAQ